MLFKAIMEIYSEATPVQLFNNAVLKAANLILSSIFELKNDTVHFLNISWDVRMIPLAQWFSTF